MICSGRNLYVENWTWRTGKNTQCVLVGMVHRKMDFKDREKYLMCSGRNLYVKNGLGGQGNYLICSGRNLYVKWSELQLDPVVVLMHVECHRSTMM